MTRLRSGPALLNGLVYTCPAASFGFGLVVLGWIDEFICAAQAIRPKSKRRPK